jgi:NAD-reducing hydrogenase small subunit
MSLLDIDSALLSLARRIDVVYGPLVDAQEFPEDVDVTLVEGAISSEDDLSTIRKIRQRTRVLISLGDCAVTGNVPAMRNCLPAARLLTNIYAATADGKGEIPNENVPALLPKARPVREFVNVDYFLPGCPPPPKLIATTLTELIDGAKPTVTAAKFG